MIQILLFAHPSIPANDIKSTVAYVSANPDKATAGIPGVGPPHHMAAAMLDVAAKIKLTTVSYRGAAASVPCIGLEKAVRFDAETVDSGDSFLELPVRAVRCPPGVPGPKAARSERTNPGCNRWNGHADLTMATTHRFDTRRWLSGAALLGALALAWVIERPSKRAPAGSAAGARSEPGPQAYERPDVADAAGYWNWWKRVAIATVREVSASRLLAVAAGVVFYALLAIFPAITAFVSFYGLFFDPATIDRHLLLLSDILPEGGINILQEQINRIAGRSRELSFGFIGGLAVALWSANAGVKAMTDALNVIEERDEQRGFLKLNALSLSFTLGAILFLAVAVGAVVAFPLAMSAFGLADVVDVTTGLVRWPLLFALAVFAIAILYRFGPSGKRRRERLFTTGVVYAALAWLLGSAALSFYMSNFADYNATYGSLGAAIGLMMWMWVSAIAVLTGAQIDAVIWKMKRSSDEPPG